MQWKRYTIFFLFFFKVEHARILVLICSRQR
jgi:hypothetical protein